MQLRLFTPAPRRSSQDLEVAIQSCGLALMSHPPGCCPESRFLVSSRWGWLTGACQFLKVARSQLQGIPLPKNPGTFIQLTQGRQSALEWSVCNEVLGSNSWARSQWKACKPAVGTLQSCRRRPLRPPADYFRRASFSMADTCHEVFDVDTRRLQCSSFLGSTLQSLRRKEVITKKELH